MPYPIYGTGLFHVIEHETSSPSFTTHRNKFLNLVTTMRIQHTKQFVVGDILSDLDVDQDIKPQTKKNYRQWYSNILFRKLKLAPSDPISTLIKTLRQPSDMIGRMKKWYPNPHSYKVHMMSLLKMVSDNESIFPKISNSVFQKYKTEFREATLSEQAYQAQKTVEKKEAVLPFEEVYEKVRKAFPKFSNARLLIELYREVPSRDDFGNVKIIKTMKEANEPNQNYLLDNNKQHRPLLLLNDFKTDDKYDTIKVFLRPSIKSIIRGMGKKPGDYLITKPNGSPYSGGKLSGLIGTILKRAGIKANGKSVLYLRQSKLNELLDDKNITMKDRIKIAKSAGHNPMTTLNYKRMKK